MVRGRVRTRRTAKLHSPGRLHRPRNRLQELACGRCRWPARTSRSGSVSSSLPKRRCAAAGPAPAPAGRTRTLSRRPSPTAHSRSRRRAAFVQPRRPHQRPHRHQADLPGSPRTACTRHHLSGRSSCRTPEPTVAPAIYLLGHTAHPSTSPLTSPLPARRRRCRQLAVPCWSPTTPYAIISARSTSGSQRAGIPTTPPLVPAPPRTLRTWPAPARPSHRQTTGFR
jgi:hypothetical protein